MRLNRAALTSQFTKDLMKNQFKLTNAKQQQLRRAAAKSGDKSLKFLSQKKGNLSLTQLTKYLSGASKLDDAPELKNVETGIRAYLKEALKKEVDELAKEQKAKLVEKSVQYRKNLRKQLNADENPLVKTTGTIYKTASQMSGANNTIGSNQGEKASVTINTTGSNEGAKAAEKQASAQNVSSPKTPPSLPQMPLD